MLKSLVQHQYLSSSRNEGVAHGPLSPLESHGGEELSRMLAVGYCFRATAQVLAHVLSTLSPIGLLRVLDGHSSCPHSSWVLLSVRYSD